MKCRWASPQTSVHQLEKDATGAALHTARRLSTGLFDRASPDRVTGLLARAKGCSVGVRRDRNTGMQGHCVQRRLCSSSDAPECPPNSGAGSGRTYAEVMSVNPKKTGSVTRNLVHTNYTVSRGRTDRRRRIRLSRMCPAREIAKDPKDGRVEHACRVMR